MVEINQLIDYAKELRCDSFITDLGLFESFQDKYLKNVRRMPMIRASSSTSGLGVFARPRRPSRILGARPRNIWRWAFAPDAGITGVPGDSGPTPGSPDEGGIEARIDDTVKLLKANKNRATDAGIKIAMENYAGDMHSLELVRLLEEAGKDCGREHGFRQRGVDAGRSIREPQKSGTLCFDHQFARHDGVLCETATPRPGPPWARACGLGQYFAHFAKVCPDAPVCALKPSPDSTGNLP